MLSGLELVVAEGEGELYFPAGTALIVQKVEQTLTVMGIPLLRL